MHRVALEQGQAKSNGLPPFSSSHIHARNTREHPRGDARQREKKKTSWQIHAHVSKRAQRKNLKKRGDRIRGREPGASHNIIIQRIIPFVLETFRVQSAMRQIGITATGFGHEPSVVIPHGNQ